MSAANVCSVQIPFSHNCFAQDGNLEKRGQISTDGLKLKSADSTTFSLYFNVAKPCELDLFLKCKSPKGQSVIECDINGHCCKATVVESDNFSDVNLFTLILSEPGYIHLDVKCLEKSAYLSQLVIKSGEDLSHLAFVPADFSQHFGRRGPSLHLSFKLPKKPTQVEWFHSEICVPAGNDVPGSYFMANGFEGGYSGLQVNSPTERRVLFSIWSTFVTDNPAEIPQSHQVKLAKCGGEDICVLEFGNEGSGGQSFLKLAWETERKYQFLTRIQPDPTDEQSAIFSCFFRSHPGDWQLLASFIRPFSKVKSHVGVYSFLENFSPKMGNHSRSAIYSNQWARDNHANWHEITEAKVTADSLAKSGNRRDFYAAYQPESNGFLLKNCGFFDESVAVGTVLKRNPTGIPPEINFEQLEAQLH